MWFNISVVNMFLVCCVLICFQLSNSEEIATGRVFRNKLINFDSAVNPEHYSHYKYEVKYFEVPVDHFNFENKDTFKIKYLFNDHHWTPGGPIFFYTGNEADIELFAENTGFIWDTAPEFKAMIVFAEHRYYGKSLPYGEKSFKEPKYWGYLTVEQALADYVDLITHIKTHGNGKGHSAKNSPVIAIGGSYGGMLAAWLRMKYPAVVVGSLASSAPIWQFPGITNDCSSLTRIITSVYKKEEKNCPGNVRESWKELEKMVKTENGRTWLTKNWKLCPPLKSQRDGKGLMDWVENRMIDVAMANYPYQANFLGHLPGYPVKRFCKHLTAGNLQSKKLLVHVYEGLREWFNFTTEAKCFNWKKNETPRLGLKPWFYQSCGQMVLPQCTTDKGDMFRKVKWDLDEYLKDCHKHVNREPRPYFITSQYGGKNIKDFSNIIFSNGLLDPWSGGGVTKNISSSLIAVVIPESAHHLDIRAAHRKDPKSVIHARNYYKHIFHKWIKEHFERMFL